MKAVFAAALVLTQAALADPPKSAPKHTPQADLQAPPDLREIGNQLKQLRSMQQELDRIMNHGALLESLPTLDVRDSTWGATHVVIAKVDKRVPGDFEVIQSIKGDLKPGNRIHLEGLKALASQDKLTIRYRPTDDHNALDFDSIACSRLILFVRKTGVPRPWLSQRRSLPRMLDDGATEPWRPVNSALGSSIAFLDNGKIYELERRWLQSGDKEILVAPSLQDEEDTHLEVARVLVRQNELLETLKIADPKKRADRLVKHVFENVAWHERALADEALRNCGEAAVPALRQKLFSDTSYGQPIALGMLANCGNSGCEVLCEWLSKDAGYWKSEVRELKPGWSDLRKRDQEDLKRAFRASNDQQVISSLSYMEIGPAQRLRARSAIAKFREVLQDSPSLRSEKPSFIRECDDAIQRLQ
jgi:hypothetical protein